MKSLSGKEMCKVLERHGWICTRVRGSHHRYEKHGSAPVVVPVHGSNSLKLGMQRALMKAAGLTDGDL